MCYAAWVEMANQPSHKLAQVLGQKWQHYCKLYPASTPGYSAGCNGYDASKTFDDSFVTSLALLVS